MSTSILLTLLKGAILKGDAKREEYVAGFSADAMHIVTANNRQPLMSALALLPAKKNGTAVKQWAGFAHAVGVAVATLDANLPNGKGWLGGAGNGPFAKAEPEKRAPYLAAHTAAVAAFDSSLQAFAEWKAPAELTDDDKAAKESEQKAKKAKRDAEQKATILAAALQSGEFVRADSLPVAFGAASLDEHIGAIAGAPINSRQAAQLRDILARFEAAQLEAAAQSEAAQALVDRQAVSASARAADREADMVEKVASHADEKMGHDATGRMSRDVGEKLEEPSPF